MSNHRLPHSVEELTPEWLTSAIRPRCPDITVTSAVIDKIIWGTSTKVLMDVRYQGNHAAYGIPNKLCIKGELDERVRQSLAGLTMTGTQIEAEFYNDLAPKLGLPLPRHWYGATEPGMGLLILDDLAAVNTRFGTPTEAWSPDDVAKALDILAILHASTWRREFPDIAWLRVGSPTIRQYTELLMSAQHWNSHFVKPEVFKLPRSLGDRERSLKALRAMWSYDDQHAHCVAHGDAHIGNTCIDTAGQPFFIDWAGPSISHWALDVPFFIVGSLAPNDRRATEHDLFHHYLGLLEKHGGPKLDGRDAWEEYCRHLMHGFGWMTLPPTMQSIENVHAMGERYAPAMVEHGTLRLLGG